MTRSRRRKLGRIQALKRSALIRAGIPVASSLLAYVPGALAAEATESGALEEVIVTAQKRVENLQDVPISVQVLDNKKLEQLNVADLDDYVKFSPSVSYSRGQGQGGNGQPGESHVYMRGVVSGANENHSGSLPSVGTYLDEQPVTTIDGTVDVHVYDIARIEVLEGPQGTLYGASSQAGTIRIISNKPDPAKFAVGYTLQGNQIHHGGTGWEAEGFVNIPLGPAAAIRLVGWDEHDAGYIDNVARTNASACIVNGIRTFPTWAGQTPMALTCPTPGVLGAGAISNAAYTKKAYNVANTKGGRGALRVNLGESWSVTPTVMAQQADSEGFFGYDPGVGDLQLAHFGPENSTDNWYQAALTVEGKISDLDLVYAGAFMKRGAHGLADYSDYSVFYDRVFGSGAYWTGSTGAPIMPQELVISKGFFQKWSHELRIGTPADKPVRATVGLFIQRQLHNIWQQYSMPGFNFSNPFGGNAAGFAPALSIPGLPNSIWLTDEQRVDRDKAVFAQVTWDVTPQLSLTGGLRYYKYENSLEGFFGFSAAYSSSTGQSQCFSPVSVAKFAPCENLSRSSNGNGTVPRLNLTYKITPEQMVYATYSKGFRPGGVNRVNGANPYAADYLQNYELGWKTQWFNRRLRWNGALFWEEWKNFQFSFLVPPSITAIANGGNARIKGIESDLQWAATRNLSFSSGLTLLDPRLTQDYCGIQGVTSCPNLVTKGRQFLPGGVFVGPLAPSGTNLPVTPKFKGNVVARYTLTGEGRWEPFAQAALVYQSQTAQSLLGDLEGVIGKQPAYALMDVAAGVNFQNIEVEAFVANVADRRAQLTRFAQSNPAHENQIYIVPAQPRTIGIKFTQKF